MKRLLVLAVIACGVVGVVSSFTSHGTAGAVDVTPSAPAPAGLVPPLHAGDPVRVVLQRDKSGEISWLGGVVQTVDAYHIAISGVMVDHVPLDGGGTTPVNRKVERWIPMTSVLYLEKLVDGGTADQTLP